MKLVSLLIIILFVSACGKTASKSNTPSSFKQVESLNGKSLEEVLSLKYDDVSVDCTLKLQSGEAVGEPLAFSWKLPVDRDKERKIVVDIGNTKVTWTHKLSLVMLMDNLTHTNPVGEEYQLEFTPRVIVHSSKQLDFSAEPRTSVSSGGGLNVDLVENTGSEVQKDNIHIIGLANFISHLSCALNSKIKPEYAEQFKRIK